MCMTYKIYIGDRLYSSWSLRGWLMLEKFNIPHEVKMVGLYSGTMTDELAHLAPAKLVPILETTSGEVIGESIAIAETLAERHAGLWPSDPTARATARWLVAEMACGFSSLRGSCPMQLKHVWQGFNITPQIQSDLTRAETLFAHARKISGAATGPLFGDYSLVDVFYTPLAARIVGYDLPVADETYAYCKLLLTDPAVQTWRTDALTAKDPNAYEMPLSHSPWPF